METLISRETLNTRMRDFYDLMILNIVKSDEINYSDLSKALEATSRKRRSYELLSTPKHILEQIKTDVGLMEQWGIYRRKNVGVGIRLKKIRIFGLKLICIVLSFNLLLTLIYRIKFIK